PTIYTLSLHDALPISLRARYNAISQELVKEVGSKPFFQKRQQDSPAQPEHPAARACIANKCRSVCQRCRLGVSPENLVHALDRRDRKSTRLNSSHLVI